MTNPEPLIPPGRGADVAQWLMMLRAHAEGLDAAPSPLDPAAIPAIDFRRLDEVHVCTRCGDRAHAVVIFTPDMGRPQDPGRFVDLCPPDLAWLKTGIAELQALGVDLDGRPQPDGL